MTLTFRSGIYPRSAVLKSAFAFTDKAYIHLDESDGYYIVEISPKQGEDEIVEGEFMNEMLFQTVRLEIADKTRAIRELSLARAFASTVIEYPAEARSPEKGESYDENILSDWFDEYE